MFFNGMSTHVVSITVQEAAHRTYEYIQAAFGRSSMFVLPEDMNRSGLCSSICFKAP